MKALEYPDDLNKFLHEYNYQPELTNRLDSLSASRPNQSLINEIVLWKVNRYVYLDDSILEGLAALVKLQNGKHVQAEPILKALLETRGIDLPMASTILRFQNPRVFQIIDRHAYRSLYDKKYPLYPTSPSERNIQVYFSYLDDLIELCQKRDLSFETIDRLLYVFDKEVNPKL